MKRANPKPIDSFEKARLAFFGTGNTTTKEWASVAEILEPRTDAAAPEYLQKLLCRRSS
jgi:hypothetical protein